MAKTAENSKHNSVRVLVLKFQTFLTYFAPRFVSDFDIRISDFLLLVRDRV